MRQMREKKLLVAVPIPCLDRNAHALGTAEMESWKRKALTVLTDCFGGATAIPAPGVNLLTDPETGHTKVLYEEKQTLVLSACESRDEFLEKRARIAEFAGRMGKALNQDSVFVLSFSSESCLIEIEYSGKGQS